MHADSAHVRLSRLPLTLRALVLVPLLAAGMDQLRASLVCGPGARTCLEAAGHSDLGFAGVLVVVGYALGSALLVARFARGRPSLGLWAVGTAGLWAACGGQALLVSALGGAAVLGGGWLQLLALGLLAGAVLALALKALPAARELVRSLRPATPRPPLPAAATALLLAAAPRAPRRSPQPHPPSCSRPPRAHRASPSPASRGIAHHPPRRSPPCRGRARPG